MWNREPVGGPFALVDQTGRPRTDADFRGTLLLVYFGFTSCPDVCPTDLAEIGRLLDLLGDRGASIQPLFITLDPERDTVAHLAAYVPSFHPRLIALTGSAEAVRNIADAYKVYHERVQLGGSDYTVDHSAFIYLMDRSGGYLGFFSSRHDGRTDVRDRRAASHDPLVRSVAPRPPTLSSGRRFSAGPWAGRAHGARGSCPGPSIVRHSLRLRTAASRMTVGPLALRGHESGAGRPGGTAAVDAGAPGRGAGRRHSGSARIQTSVACARPCTTKGAWRRRPSRAGSPASARTRSTRA